MLLVFTQSIVSLVCEEKTTALKKTFDNATSSNNKGSLNFIIPNEVLQKNTSFKRSEIIKLGNYFLNNNVFCELCNNKYFANKRPPIIRIKEERKKDIKYICQAYWRRVRFASVFDTHFRIPVYSAYQIKTVGSSRDKKGTTSKTWKYEPQLENLKYKVMLTTKQIKILSELTQDDIKNQATFNDYEYSGWDKGHLFPNSYIVSTSAFFFLHHTNDRLNSFSYMYNDKLMVR